MSSIVAPSEFIGKFAISKAFNDGTSKIQDYIDVYEQKYMNQLLGAACYTDFTTNITLEKYAKLLDPLSEDISTGLIISEGIKSMLKYYIYSHYKAGDLGVATANGQVDVVPEGGKMQSQNDSNILNFYNQGTKTYVAIQKYIRANKSDYPLFKGIHKELNWYR